tara:strand:+ start:952 stop:1371 length:420 start_codon:yes stop_codon:yes gene_type:complete
MKRAVGRMYAKLILDAMGIRLHKRISRRQKRAVYDGIMSSIEEDRALWNTQGEKVQNGLLKMISLTKGSVAKDTDIRWAIFWLKDLMRGREEGFTPMAFRLKKEEYKNKKIWSAPANGPLSRKRGSRNARRIRDRRKPD